MKRIIKNNYKIIIGFILGLIFSITTVYAVESYIESNKITYTNHNKKNVEEAIDELYEKSGVHKEKWVDPILNGADPVLKEPLIPVEIKPNGEVYYANENSEWYNYSEKRWANAVILIDNPSNTNYEVGDHIKEDDIESYFVWIPRYQYKIWDLGQYSTVIEATTLTNQNYDTSIVNAMNGARIIDIKFGDVNKIPKMNESEAKIDSYYTHPAFTLGSKNLNGIWVGKFETGYKGATSTATSSGDVTNPDKVIIKPDVYAWRNIKISNAFKTSYNYERELDSHMIKNTEWGAVAYLSHSQYGIGTEVRLNNTSDFKTGYATAVNIDKSVRTGISSLSTDSTKTKLWNTTIGYLASTSGNITGIYDMSGGAWEFTAGCIEGNVGDSEFSTTELANYMNSGYIDRYNKNSTIKTYNYRILGDATGELGPFYNYYYKGDGASSYPNSNWHGETSRFVHSGQPWFVRGGLTTYGGVPGILAFSPEGGRDYPYDTFRVSLAPIK